MSSACGPTPGPNHGASIAASGASNPRKFSEKIAMHAQRQAEETAAFQEVMMDLTSTRIQAQKVRLARTQGPYYGGSLPNVNQIGRNTSDLQVCGSFHSTLDSSRSTRHHGLVERVQRERRFISPSRPYRRQMDSSHSSSVYLSPPPDPSWRRNWSSNFPADKSQIFQQFPTTALNRTNSDSALHTSVMNPPSAEMFGAQSRRAVFSYPVPPIEESGPDDGRLLKPWDSRKLPLLTSRPKSCEVPGITVFPSPDQQGSAPHGSMVLNSGGSLPDLTSLHFPSPLPTPLDPDELSHPCLSTGNGSTSSLTGTLTQLGITGGGFSSAGLLPSSNPSLQSSLSNPNIQSSLSSHSFPNSLSSASLHSSLSNPSIQSSLSSSPSLRSSLSSQSLQSSLSSSSLQSAASNQGYGGGTGSFGTLGSGQMQISSSPRRRVQLSPLILPADTRRHHPKQFSPTSSTLSSITQGVALDTSKVQTDQRSSQYSFPQHAQPLQLQPTLSPAQTHTLRPSSHTQQLHLHNMQNLQKTTQSLQPLKTSNHSAGSFGPADADGVQMEPQMQSFSADLDSYSESMFLNSLLDDPYLSLQFSGRQNQNLNLTQQVSNVDSDKPMLSQSQCAAFADGRLAVPNIILTDSPSGLSREITSALSAVPGFEMEPFCSEDRLQMEPLALEGLMLADGDLLLADPAVEDSFRSDHLK
ncbi:CREB-regulated transcription coactivator 2 isoform X3 [Danio rerio]|uniref:CREB-regulated transcription coactivator 2 isoform X3 n=1 Tax=Danio rerio TaxID=7955 RepID=A0AC58HIE7_DANRE